MDLFHYEIISFRLRKATIKLATGFPTWGISPPPKKGKFGDF
jgi:hypothetical protein